MMFRRSAILVILSAGFAAFVLYSLVHVEPLELNHSRLKHDSARVMVEGEIRNTGADASSVDLEIRYYDQRGAKLGEERVALGHVASGERRMFITDGRELATASSFTIVIDRGHNPYGN
jgi:hypothetical protein